MGGADFRAATGQGEKWSTRELWWPLLLKQAYR